jgi:hypothetical protein
LILQRIHGRNVLRIFRVDQNAHGQQDIRRVEFVHRQIVGSGRMEDPVDVMVLIDDHRGDVALAAIR